MRNLDSWVKRASSSAPAILGNEATDCSPPTKRPRGLRAPGQYRTVELIDEIRKKRVLWSRDARGFHSPAARSRAYKGVADAMNRRFPELRPWHYEEVDFHWRLLVQYQYACAQEHRSGAKPHTFTCHREHMSFMNAVLLGCTDYRSFVPRM